MIYDITQPLFESVVWPGDPAPEHHMLSRIADGAFCNVTALSMCAHNGTHVDAPCHFIQDGKSINQVALSKFVGMAYVVHWDGDITADNARSILETARSAGKDAAKRILIGGKATVTLEAARVFAEAGIDLIGNESQTVGPESCPMAVHLTLLGAEVVLLEGIRLGGVPDGVYLLNAAPLNLTGSDGAPCRAILMGD